MPLNTSSPSSLAIVGAGPVGLAAAAHAIARGLRPLIFEAGDAVGASLLDYGHVRLFSPWRCNVDRVMAGQLEATGWVAPAAEELPLARQIVERVLVPFARLPAVSDGLQLNSRVI